jgi:hypothetical protein
MDLPQHQTNHAAFDVPSERAGARLGQNSRRYAVEMDSGINRVLENNIDRLGKFERMLGRQNLRLSK